MKSLSKKRVLIFVLLLTALTTLTNVLASFLQNETIISLLIMWSPGIAAIMTGLFTRRSFSKMGWAFSIKWVALGWITPILYAVIAYSVVWMVGFGSFPSPTFLERARFTLGMETNSNSLVIISAFFYITILNLIPAMLMSLGEEMGWRGLLVPELSDWVGFKKASWISGLVWATWHLPGILMGNYGAIGTPLLLQLFCFFLMVVSTGIILAWLRMKSNSLWPAVVFHATHNGVIQMFFDRITIETAYTKYFTGEFGIALALLASLFAWYFFKRSGEIELQLNTI